MQTTNRNETNCQAILLADCSSSLAPCFDKLQNVLQNAYGALCESCKVGVGVYAEKFQKISSPDAYREDIAEALRNIKPACKTDLCDALYGAADCLNLSQEGRKLIIVFSDGNFDGSAPFDAAREISSAGIELHAIGFSGAADCFDENLQKLTNGAFAHSCDAASYIDALFPRNGSCAHPEPCCSCANDIYIEAHAPTFDGFCTVRVHINDGCTCTASALCVRLMLGEKTVSEKFLLTSGRSSFPLTVTFIVPEDMLAGEYASARLYARVYGNPIMI